MDFSSRTNFSTVQRKRLFNLLLERKLIDRARLEELRDRSVWMKQPLEKLLMDEGDLPEEVVLSLCSEVSGLPVLDIAHLAPDDTVLELVSIQTATSLRVFPVKMERGVLFLATDSLRDADDAEQLRMVVGKPVHWALCSSETLDGYIRHFYGVAAQSVLNMQISGIQRGKNRKHGPSAVQSEGDVPALVNEIIRDAIHVRATDIHLEPKQGRVWLRYRIDGMLYDMPVPEDIHPRLKAIVSSIKIMAQMNIAERRLPQDGRFSAEDAGTSFDIRVSVLPSNEGESVNLRILNRHAHFMKLDELSIPPRQQLELNRLLHQPYGIILFAGPTGSGKTTSLYAALDSLNNSERKIITIEDPIEYRIPGITQMQTNSEIGFTFASGLRSVLRHDPDVVLIGEIRDEETADIAISSALTGHLVFSTLHTNDSISAVVRLHDMGVPHYLTAAGLLGVVAQRLVRFLCPACREVHLPEAELLEEIRQLYPERSEVPQFYRKTGCPKCRFTGYFGRKAIFEILEINDSLSPLIVSGAPATQILQAVRGQGFRTLRESAWEMVFAGETSVDELMRVTKPVSRA